MAPATKLFLLGRVGVSERLSRELYPSWTRVSCRWRATAVGSAVVPGDGLLADNDLTLRSHRMKPNIDRKGRIARAITGSMCCAGGIAIWVFDWPTSGTLRWVISVAALAAGAFQLFEAKRSWCVMRACGFRTPM